jgi:metaxin
LDALAFAYLHCLLRCTNSVRIEVSRRANLVAWEKKVAGTVRGAFQQA